MACDSLLRTILLDVVNGFFCQNLLSTGLPQQLVTSLQMTICNKPDFNKLVANDEIDKFVATCCKGSVLCLPPWFASLP